MALLVDIVVLLPTEDEELLLLSSLLREEDKTPFKFNAFLMKKRFTVRTLVRTPLNGPVVEVEVCCITAVPSREYRTEIEDREGGGGNGAMSVSDPPLGTGP